MGLFFFCFVFHHGHFTEFNRSKATTHGILQYLDNTYCFIVCNSSIDSVIVCNDLEYKIILFFHAIVIVVRVLDM